MQLCDPQYWREEANYGNKELLSIAKHFKQPLTFALFDQSKIAREWEVSKIS